MPVCEAATSTHASFIVYWQSTGNDHVEIGTIGQKLFINITQLTDIGTIFNVTFSSSNNRITFHPVASFNTLYVLSGDTLTDSVIVENSEGADRVENVSIRVTVTNSFTQEIIGSETVYATLLPTQSDASTQPSEQSTTEPNESLQTRESITTDDLILFFTGFVVVAIIAVLVLLLFLRRSNKKNA